MPPIAPNKIGIAYFQFKISQVNCAEKESNVKKNMINIKMAEKNSPYKIPLFPNKFPTNNPKKRHDADIATIRQISFVLSGNAVNFKSSAAPIVKIIKSTTESKYPFSSFFIVPILLPP